MGELVLRTLVLVALVGGCTKRVNQCTSDSDCTDPAYPFCDLNGEFPASGGMKDVCTVTPANCPVDRCGCTPGAVLSCSADQATVCGADGKSSATTACALGCASDGTRCATFEPSNGLGGALGDAAGDQDVTLPAGAKIDTDSGTVTDSNGAPVALQSVVVTQPSGPSIRAFIAKSLTIDDLSVSGANAIAFVASGEIKIQGDIELAAKGSVSAPGAGTAGLSCTGMDSQQVSCGSGQTTTAGASGGGNATVGGSGGGGPAGGMAATAFSPLVGGCSGGALRDGSGNLLAAGGGGGGAIEIVSAQDISITGRGFINVAGGGAADLSNAGGGGGSAGTVVLEAPQVSISGALAGITANGGAGGGCSMMGPDGQKDTMPAGVSGCTSGNYSAGAGGTGAVAATSGNYCVSMPCLLCFQAGGGGGAAGRVRIATRDGAYSSDSSPVLSAVVSTATLQPQ